MNKQKSDQNGHINKITLINLYLMNLLALELIVRAFTVTPFTGPGLAPVIALTLLATLIFYLLTIALPEKARKVFTGLVFGVAAILWAGQIVYYSYFKMYFTIFSMTQAGEVAGFWKDILLEIGKNWLPIILCLLVPTFYFLIKDNVDFARPRKDQLKRFGIIGIIALISPFIVIGASEAGPNTPKDALFTTNSITTSIPNLGVGTGMFLDGSRLIFGFTPKIEFENEGSDNPISGPGLDNPGENGATVYGYNMMDIDFNKLAEEESNSTRALMHKYFASQLPSRQNEKTGIFKGKNLVFVCGESFSTFAVHQKYTPTLYKMVHEGYQFKNFYNPVWGVSTSDGEYVQTVGLIPKAGVWSMRESSKNWLPFTMGNQFSKLNYRTLAYHNHYAEYYGRTSSHPNLGYKYKGLGTGLKVKEQWPESDLEMIDLTTAEFIGTEPWHVYYMTVSGHKNYNWAGQMMARIHRDDVADLNMSEACKAYVACNMELDLAMKLLIERLEEAGELENTVFAISGDHYPYGLSLEEISEFLGHPVETEFELYKSTFILWAPGMEAEVVEKPCSSLDIIPTLSNMFGLEYDSRLLSGRDIFSNQDPLVMFSSRSWITDQGKYNARTKDGEDMPKEYIEYINNVVANRFNFAKLILEEDYYKYVIPRWPAPVR